MNSIALSLIGRGPSPSRDHGRAFTDANRGPRGQPVGHPLNRATEMMLRFRDWDREYTGPEDDPERVALLLDGNELPNVGLKPSIIDSERCYRVPRLVVFRESPVPYRMRAACLAVPTESADAFAGELEAAKQYLTGGAVIGTLNLIATGRRENENPPMSYVWDPHPIDSRDGHTDVFVFLQVNHDDRPGQRDRRSCWIRLKDCYIFEGVINEEEPGNRRFESFADLWPLLEEPSLVPRR